MAFKVDIAIFPSCNNNKGRRCYIGKNSSADVVASYFFFFIFFYFFAVMVFTVNIKKPKMIDDEQALSLICVLTFTFGLSKFAKSSTLICIMKELTNASFFFFIVLDSSRSSFWSNSEAAAAKTKNSKTCQICGAHFDL